MKRFFLMFMLYITANVVYAQEIRCKVINPSPFYKGSIKFSYMGELQPYDIITVEDTSNLVFFDFHPNPRREFIIFFTKDQDRYCTFPQNLIPVSTNMVFDQDVLTGNSTFLYNDILLFKEMWVPVHYADVLGSRDREILPKYEPRLLVDDKEEYEMVYGTSEWYDVRYEIIDNGMIIFFNPIIYNDGVKFLINNIEKHENIYTVKCFVPRDFHNRLVPPSKLMPYFNWSLCTEDVITMILFVDGEYMDIYINENNAQHKFGTIIKIKEEFTRQFQNLIKNGECDLSKVHFPRRADGSMDYPPPVSTPDINNTEETENTDDSAIAELSTGNSAKKGLGFKIILIAGIALLSSGGATVLIIKRRK